MDDTNTLDLARKLVDSIAGSSAQTAGALLALASAGSLHPLSALAATACGAALLAKRYKSRGLDAFGRPAKAVDANRRGFTMRLGTEHRTGRPITLEDDDLRQHMLVLGSTGANKTEFLLGLSEQAVSAGSGLLFVDGKGDVSLFAKVFALARQHGREDDLLVLNMMTGNAGHRGAGDHLLSNTLNPFATDPSDTLTQLVVSLMDEVGGDGAMWKGRATAMFSGLVRALVWLRDNDGLELDIPTLRDHIALRAIVGLASGASAPGMPEEIRACLSSYLTSLPGYNPERGERQAQVTLDQHRHLEMQFAKILGSLADVYGHIFRTRLSDIDMQDVVLNRRILVVMLPALEKSGDELANLGKIVVATLKGMMGSALGNRITGSWEGIVDNRVTKAESPFLCVLDEVGYYAVEGLALMAAQARSLGFSMVYGSEDLQAMTRLNEKEAASIIANTNTTIHMRTQEGFSPGRGVFDRTHTDLRHRMGQIGRHAGPDELLSLKAGEGIILFKAMKVHARLMHFLPRRAAIPVRATLRANYFLALPPAKSATGAAR